MGDQAEFPTRFHNLDGDLKGERTKNLFQLLRTTNFTNEEQLETALQNLKPKSYQENLFYIDTLIYFKRSKELLDILKGGNDVHISKILKQAWFFQSGFDKVEAETFVTEFLPHVSYAVKKKFINQVSNHWSEQKKDSLFDALQNKYGVPLAVTMLHKCSAAKIKDAIVQFDLKLNSNQVLNLYNKDEDLFLFYLDRTNNYNDEKVLKHIAIKNPKLFLKLKKENQIYLYRVGRRTSKGIFNVAKDDVLKDSEYYLKFLNNAVVTRKLGQDFVNVFKNLFPKKLNRLNMYCTSCKLLPYYPKGRRWNLVNQTFIETFKDHDLKDLLLNFGQLDKLNPPKDISELWAELHYKQKVGNFNDYLKYYAPSKAIPLLKEKINVTSDIQERHSLVFLMIESCKISQDLDSLVEVLKYICFRHRNEETSFRTEMLGVLRNAFKLQDFNENHWKYIDEQIQILRIQKRLYIHDNGDFIEGHLEYLVKNGKDHKSLLIEYLKDMYIEGNSKALDYKDLSLSKKLYTDMIDDFGSLTDVKSTTDLTDFKYNFLDTILNFCLEHPEFCIKILDFPEFVELIHKCCTSDFKDYIIANVMHYNAKFPQHALSYNGDILEIVKKTIDQNKYIGPFASVIGKIILTKDRDDFANKLLNFYFQHLFEAFPDSDIVRWFLRNEPKVLSPHMTVVAKNYSLCFGNSRFSKNYLMYKLLKHYSHLGFDKIISDFLRKSLDDHVAPRFILNPICILLSTEDFISFVSEKYLPKKDKLDLTDDEMREIYDIQCEIAKRLAHVNVPYKMLPTIMKFCRGDYLQSALPALQKAFYRSPERILYSYVETLSKQAVSVRKHAIFLSCEVLDKQHTLNLLTNTKESNVSSLKYLFSATLKYFLKNPSDELLDKVIANMNTIDVNDKETLDSLKDITVPTKYRAQYLEKCWKFFEGLDPEAVKISDYLNAFLNHMSADILSILSTSFVTDVINRYFPLVEGRLDNIDCFIVRVLQTLVSERIQIFNIVFDIMSKKFSDSMRIAFFNSFVNTVKNKPDQQLLAMFAENWHKNFTLIDSFDEHIALKLISFKFEDSSVDDLASKTANYLEELITEFGFHCFDRFTEQFKKVFNYRDMVEEYTFYLALIKHKDTPSICTLVLNNIMNLSDDEDETLRDTFNEIINIIRNVATPIVRINLKYFLIENEIHNFSNKTMYSRVPKVRRRRR